MSISVSWRFPEMAPHGAVQSCLGTHQKHSASLDSASHRTRREQHPHWVLSNHSPNPEPPHNILKARASHLWGKAEQIVMGSLGSTPKCVHKYQGSAVDTNCCQKHRSPKRWGQAGCFLPNAAWTVIEGSWRIYWKEGGQRREDRRCVWSFGHCQGRHIQGHAQGPRLRREGLKTTRRMLCSYTPAWPGCLPPSPGGHADGTGVLCAYLWEMYLYLMNIWSHYKFEKIKITSLWII